MPTGPGDGRHQAFVELDRTPWNPTHRGTSPAEQDLGTHRISLSRNCSDTLHAAQSLLSVLGQVRFWRPRTSFQSRSRGLCISDRASKYARIISADPTRPLVIRASAIFPTARQVPGQPSHLLTRRRWSFSSPSGGNVADARFEIYKFVEPAERNFDLPALSEVAVSPDRTEWLIYSLCFRKRPRKENANIGQSLVKGILLGRLGTPRTKHRIESVLVREGA